VGTDVEAFSVGGCGGDKAVRRDEAERRVSELLIEEPLEIYAAHSSDEGGLWIYFQSPRDGRVVTVIAGDFIVGISQSCDRVTGEMTLGPSGGFIIPPQFER
jgi:hypothetical protein